MSKNEITVKYLVKGKKNHHYLRRIVKHIEIADKVYLFADVFGKETILNMDDLETCIGY